MKRLIIKKVGPIEFVDIILNRYNLFIGKQSSGKSTIAKIISNSLWLEKKIETHPYIPLKDYASGYLKGLVDFHNMKDYVNANSYILYESDYLKITFENLKCNITLNESDLKYRRKKILYIPAERNLVVYSDSISGANNLRSFAVDWQSARDYYDKKHQQSVLDLGIKYYNATENGNIVNHIVSSKKNKKYDINLMSGSSGLQSVIPITTTIDFYTGEYYKNATQMALMKSDDQFNFKKLVNYFFNLYKTNKELDLFINSDNNDISARIQPILTETMKDTSRLMTPTSTCFILEEPENNLFPETQYSLIKFIIDCTNRGNRNHGVTITTHSPYILSTLNILLLAGELKRISIDDKDIDNIVGGTCIDGNSFSAWSVSDGKATSILDSDTHMISANYLDTVSIILSDKFNLLYQKYLSVIKNA